VNPIALREVGYIEADDVANTNRSNRAACFNLLLTAQD
jgi:hypothetical protein